MTIAIYTSGMTYFSSVSIEEARSAIDRNEPLPCWWFASHGQRYREDIWFPPERVDLIRTERDDG